MLVHAIEVRSRLELDKPDILHHSVLSVALKLLETLSYYVEGQENILILSKFIRSESLH